MTYRHNRYTTNECIPELVVTVPAARSTIVENWSVSKPMQTVIICVTFTELLSAVVKITRHYHHFPWLSMTFAIFHDFPGLENGLPKFHDFPWPGGTLMTTVTPIILLILLLTMAVVTIIAASSLLTDVQSESWDDRWTSRWTTTSQHCTSRSTKHSITVHTAAYMISSKFNQYACS